MLTANGSLDLNSVVEIKWVFFPLNPEVTHFLQRGQQQPRGDVRRSPWFHVCRVRWKRGRGEIAILISTLEIFNGIPSSWEDQINIIAGPQTPPLLPLQIGMVFPFRSTFVRMRIAQIPDIQRQILRRFSREGTRSLRTLGPCFGILEKGNPQRILEPRHPGIGEGNPLAINSCGYPPSQFLKHGSG